MENLVKRYARALWAQRLCAAAVLFAALGFVEFIVQPFSWLHGARHLPLTPAEGNALVAILGFGLTGAIGLNVVTFRWLWPLGEQIWMEEVRAQARAKIDAEIAAEKELLDERLEWIKMKAIYQAKRRAKRRRPK